MLTGGAPGPRSQEAGNNTTRSGGACQGPTGGLVSSEA